MVLSLCCCRGKVLVAALMLVGALATWEAMGELLPRHLWRQGEIGAQESR